MDQDPKAKIGSSGLLDFVLCTIGTQDVWPTHVRIWCMNPWPWYIQDAWCYCCIYLCNRIKSDNQPLIPCREQQSADTLQRATKATKATKATEATKATKCWYLAESNKSFLAKFFWGGRETGDQSWVWDQCLKGFKSLLSFFETLPLKFSDLFDQTTFLISQILWCLSQFK